MTSRERFHLTMRGGAPGRPPLLEEGLRDDVLAAWRDQGQAQGTDLNALFHYDRRERIDPDLCSHAALTRFPPTRDDLEAFRRGLDVDDATRLPAHWSSCVESWHTRAHILDLYLHRGLFPTMGVQAWATLEPVLYFLAEHRTLAREVMDIQADFAVQLAERVLREVEVDMVCFSEPIADNHGPLISPEMYRQIVLPGYRRVLEALRSHGVTTIVYMVYGNALPLLADVLEAGFDTLWAMEVETHAMDYRRLRKKFGRQLRLIGGIDLDVLSQDEQAIDREIHEKVPPLLAQGGYIPLADGRVRANIPWRSYVHYRRMLEHVVRAHHG